MRGGGDDMQESGHGAKGIHYIRFENSLGRIPGYDFAVTKDDS